jgi:hypothetical protein
MRALAAAAEPVRGTQDCPPVMTGPDWWKIPRPRIPRRSCGGRENRCGPYPKARNPLDAGGYEPYDQYEQ